MDLNLQNHVAVVTGGASGIGRAIADGFAAEGSNTALWDLSETVSQVAEEIQQAFGCSAVGCKVDVTVEADVKAALDKTLSALGPVDHLVHAAATGSGKFGFPFTNLEPGDWKKVIEVNVMGMVNVAHAVTPGMVERKSGTMVFIASIAGQNGSQTDPPYSASKAANINFAQCMAKDLASEGIRVNSLCPGMVQTALNKSVWQAWNDQQPKETKRNYEDWAEEKVQNIVPLKKWQRPEDIADMAVFLSSNRAAHVTGQTINVDGGYVMH
ncbi:MAG: SDR family oxidoreductase [Planctomycetes bacterium]|nr:SDR family oxidoreductase [Planctomycetota bacterium]